MTDEDLKKIQELRRMRTPQYQLPVEQRSMVEPQQIEPLIPQDLNLDEEKTKQFQQAFNNQPSFYEKLLKNVLGK
jgi:hypothetical protein